MDGVRINGDSGSVDTGTRGREFMIAHTSAMKVVNTSCVRVFPVVLTSIELSICRAVRIIRSQAPPMWEECGELNFHTVPELYN